MLSGSIKVQDSRCLPYHHSDIHAGMPSRHTYVVYMSLLTYMCIGGGMLHVGMIIVVDKQINFCSRGNERKARCKKYKLVMVVLLCFCGEKIMRVIVSYDR